MLLITYEAELPAISDGMTVIDLENDDIWEEKVVELEHVNKPTDIIYAIAANKDDEAIGNIMSEKVVTVDEDVMVSDAIDIINEKKIGRLIVLESDGLPCGIVTRTDLLDVIAGY